MTSAISFEEVTDFLKRFVGPVVDAITTDQTYEKQWKDREWI
jgi:hypothetical protein